MNKDMLFLLIGGVVIYFAYRANQVVDKVNNLDAEKLAAAGGKAAVDELQNIDNEKIARGITSGFFSGIGDSVSSMFTNHPEWNPSGANTANRVVN